MYALMILGEGGEEFCEGQTEGRVTVQVGCGGTGWHPGKGAQERLPPRWPQS